MVLEIEDLNLNALQNTLSYGLSLEQNDDLAGAEGIYRRTLLASADWAEGWYRLGVVCLKQRKSLDAISHFEHCRELNHRLADTWYFQGIALEWLTRTDEAELAFRRAIALAPQFGYAYLNLGIA